MVGLGGSGTNDAGAGLLGWLADRAGLAADAFGERLGRGGAGLRGCSRGDLAPLAGLRARWADVELVVASDVDAPLLGFHGASAGFAEQKGATPEQAQELERALGDFAAAAVHACGLPQRLTAEPGAGAAGGLGFGLLLLGGRRVAGSQAVLDTVGMADRLRRNDLVVTGEGCFDWQSLRGKVVAGVARAPGTSARRSSWWPARCRSGAGRCRRSGWSPPTRWHGRRPRCARPWPTRQGPSPTGPSGWPGPGRADRADRGRACRVDRAARGRACRVDRA